MNFGLTFLQRLPIILGWMVAAAVASRAGEPADGDTVELTSPHFGIIVPRDRAGLGKSILEVAESARHAVLEQMPRPLDDRVRLIWCSTEQEFQAQLDRPMGRVLAAAVAERRQIYLNGPQLRRLDREGLYRSLVHEFTHIYLGRVVRVSIPVWLNEGVAMHVAREWDMSDAASLALDGLLGALLPAEQLARGFPIDATRQHQAYRQSYSMTAYLLHLRYEREGIRGLVADLAALETQSGPLAFLFDPDWLAAFERNWQRQWLRPGRWLLLASPAVFWLLVTAMLVFAYLRKRRGRKRVEARWAMEEEFTYHDDGFDD